MCSPNTDSYVMEETIQLCCPYNFFYFILEFQNVYFWLASEMWFQYALSCDLEKNAILYMWSEVIESTSLLLPKSLGKKWLQKG